MYKIVLAIFFCFSTLQATGADYFVIVKTATGDLNKDGIADLVNVLQDTIADTAPYRLEIYFTKPGNKTELILATDSAIVADYPEGRDGWRTGIQFTGIEITNGVLIISTDLLRGWYKHKFRYRNNKFELVGFTMVSSDGLGKIYSTDFNLSTGKRITQTERYDDDKAKSTIKKEKIKLSKLPDLKYFTPFPLEGIEMP